MSDSKGAAIDKLIDDLWGRALDMTSPDFANDKDYETAQSNYKKHCLIELQALLAQEVKRVKVAENIHHKENSDAVFHAIKNPTPVQRRIHEGLMGKFDNRIKYLERLG